MESQWTLAKKRHNTTKISRNTLRRKITEIAGFYPSSPKHHRAALDIKVKIILYRGLCGRVVQEHVPCWHMHMNLDQDDPLQI